MNDKLIALIEYRLKEADDSINEARVLLKEGMSMRAVNEQVILRNVLCCIGASAAKADGCVKIFGRDFFF